MPPKGTDQTTLERGGVTLGFMILIWLPVTFPFVLIGEMCRSLLPMDAQRLKFQIAVAASLVGFDEMHL
jgi:hypothetical protein